MTAYVEQWTPALNRTVLLREGTSDRQVWADTFTGLYHVPPPDMPPPATVLDLGANIGLTAAHYQATWPHARIVAVEMDAECADLARRNAPNVEVWQHAIAGVAGWGSVVGERAEAFQFAPGDAGGERVVQALTLGQRIIASFEQPQIVDFCKIDVEGAEWGILANGASWAPYVTHLLVELHPTGAPIGDAESQEHESRLLEVAAVGLLDGLGFNVKLRHADHPRAVWAWR